jgi:dUTP pyrophosphatase
MKIKILNYGYVKKPFRAHENDAGADVYAIDRINIEPGRTRKIPLGFGLEVPIGYAAYVIPRSSLASKGIASEIPPVDSGYTGEIHAIITNHSSDTFRIEKGDRIAQLVIMPVIVADFVEEFGEVRADGGFGSTGK